MAYIDLPAPFWGPPVATSSALPTSAPTGQVRVALDTEQAYLWDGAAWQEVFGGGGGSGDVVGPASATDNAVARFDGTTGKLLQNSVVIIGDTGNVTGVVNFTATGTTTLAVALTGPLKAASGVVSASAINLASAEVTGVLPVANGGSGTSTAFTTGSVIFAGASGTYSQDNANFFWDDTNNRLGILTTSPAVALHVAGTVQTSGSIILGNSAGTLSVSSTNLSLGTSTTTTTTIAGGVALFSGLTITANTNPTFNLAQTWNGAGVTFTGIKLNITDTASAADSLLMDLQVGGTSQFAVYKDRTFGSTNAGCGIRAFGTLRFGFGYVSSTFTLQALGSIGFSATSDVTTGSPDIRIFREAAGHLGLRNGTNPQTFTVYNTYTDATNYERGGLSWASNILQFGTFSGGTGSSRAIDFYTGSITRWRIGSTGHFVAPTDNTYDIGASGATRPRTLYVGTDVNIAGTSVAGFMCTSSTVAVSSDVTLTNKAVHLVDTTAARALTLPAAAANAYLIVKDSTGGAGANNITISPAAGTIDGAGTLVISTNYGVARLMSNGTDWFVL